MDALKRTNPSSLSNNISEGKCAQEEAKTERGSGWVGHGKGG